MTSTLGPKFWDKLSQISTSLGMNPADLLAVMYYESGIDSNAHNKNGNASGLIQFMPDTLSGLGWKGTHADFRELDAVQQLDYVEKYIRNETNFNGGAFKSATQYYVANLWPAALKLPEVQAGDPKAVIIDSNPKIQRYPKVSLEQERAAYKANSGLDVDRDGKITYGDLDAVMSGVKNSSGYRRALASMNSGQEYVAGKKEAPTGQPAKQMSFLDQVNNLLNRFMTAISSNENKNLIKKANYKQLPQNNFVLKILRVNAEPVDSLEFARILCLALEEEIQADAAIHTNKNAVEVVCTVHGPSDTCRQAVIELSEAVAESFKKATQKIGYLELKPILTLNKKSNYQELDIKLAGSAYRQFHLKFIK